MNQNQRAILAISLSAAFLFYKYIIQNFPSVMTTELMDAFHLHGLGLGVLSGVYFWTYLIVPLFVGIILDCLGVRWVCGIAILCCSLGMYIFSHSWQLSSAMWSRALVGAGVSFATVAYLKLASVLFDKKYYALLTSILIFSGMIGAVFGQMPLAFLMHLYGWRDCLSIVAIFGLGLSLVYVGFVSDQPFIHKKISYQPIVVSEIINIFKSKQNWILTAYSGLAFSPVVIFCGLWGNLFLQTTFHIDKLIAPSLISMVFLGLALASPVYAYFSIRVRNRLRFMVYNTLGSAIALSLVLFVPVLPFWLLAVLLFIFGFALGAFPLVFVLGKESNPIQLVGTAIAMINASDALFDAIIEPMIGKILDIYHFSGPGFKIALLILPLMQIIAAVLLMRARDPQVA